MIEHREVDYDLVRQLKAAVSDRLAAARKEAEAGGDPLTAADERQLAKVLIDRQLDQLAARSTLDADTEAGLAEAVYNELYALGRIQPLLDDPDVAAVHCNGCDDVHVRLANGDMIQAGPVADSDEQLVRMIQRVASRHDRAFDDGPGWQVNVGLPGGARLHAMQAVSERPYVTIRQHDLRINSLAHLVDLQVIDPPLRAFLQAAVAAKLNILVAGAPNAGKTTFLRCLCNARPDKQQMLIAVEDPPELGLSAFPERHPNLRELQPREPNTDGRGQVTAGELVQATLRMDPDRVVVGEVLGGEVIPMLLAMSQGTDGSMSTIHGGSLRQVVDRVTFYAEMSRTDVSEDAVKRLFAHAVDLVVYLRFDADGRRAVSAISQLGWNAEAGSVATVRLWEAGRDRRAVPDMPVQGGVDQRLQAVGYGPADHPHGW